jgi:hypothetical protein
MKQRLLILIALVFWVAPANATETNTFEYATIRWDGENTYVILPSGKVDFVGKQLKSIKVPDRVDTRTYYFSVTMNSLGTNGYEFAGISGDQNMIVMKRQVSRPTESSRAAHPRLRSSLRSK